jgi:phage antirepressor YoqD-like protein
LVRANFAKNKRNKQMPQQHNYNTASNLYTPNPFLLSSGRTLFEPREICTMALHIDASPPTTMNSLDLSALTGKRHDHLMKDIRKILKELGLHAPEFSGAYQTAQGNTYQCFLLRRREVDVLLTGYSASLRAKVIDRWRELEDQADIPFTPQLTLDSIQKLAAEWESHHAVMACEVKALKAEISRNAEKVEFYDDLANTNQLFNAFEVANLLSTGRNRLLKFLRGHKILMSNVHRLNVPYQKHKNAGRFEVKASRHKNHQTGAIEIKLTTLFTGKGVVWLQKYIAKHGRSGL